MKILAIRQSRSGQNSSFITDTFDELTLAEALTIGEKGVLENITIVNITSGKQYLRSKRNKIQNDNLESKSITCNEGDFLLFDGTTLFLKTVNGRNKRKWSATSGKSEASFHDQDKPHFGPLPEGEYTVRFDKTMDISSSEHLWDSIKWILKSPRWGFIVTPLEPSFKNKMYGRGDFYIHGGFFPGSKGCIDLQFENGAFHILLRLYKHNFKLIVRYFS